VSSPVALSVSLRLDLGVSSGAELAVAFRFELAVFSPAELDVSLLPEQNVQERPEEALLRAGEL